MVGCDDYNGAEAISLLKKFFFPRGVFRVGDFFQQGQEIQFFTTDSLRVWRGIDKKADAIKATKVNGVYDGRSVKNPCSHV